MPAVLLKEESLIRSKFIKFSPIENSILCIPGSLINFSTALRANKIYLYIFDHSFPQIISKITLPCPTIFLAIFGKTAAVINGSTTETNDSLNAPLPKQEVPIPLPIKFKRPWMTIFSHISQESYASFTSTWKTSQPQTLLGITDS